MRWHTNVPRWKEGGKEGREREQKAAPARCFIEGRNTAVSAEGRTEGRKAKKVSRREGSISKKERED